MPAMLMTLPPEAGGAAVRSSQCLCYSRVREPAVLGGHVMASDNPAIKTTRMRSVELLQVEGANSIQQNSHAHRECPRQFVEQIACETSWRIWEAAGPRVEGLPTSL